MDRDLLRHHRRTPRLASSRRLSPWNPPLRTCRSQTRKNRSPARITSAVPQRRKKASGQRSPLWCKLDPPLGRRATKKLGGGAITRSAQGACNYKRRSPRNDEPLPGFESRRRVESPTLDSVRGARRIWMNACFFAQKQMHIAIETLRLRSSGIGIDDDECTGRSWGVVQRHHGLCSKMRQLLSD